ncbi:Phosphatidate cytidylyltransferase [Hondaea fermentalgiana]|uniref:Phosphatidate cytidylyltransferase n=1 Tax=Hondaea fermentalgiana TaxID=2315210 RepID=A0A2R5GDL1_9STRA|nr:Phosphatidate cytidylyltransferase [Hondaea fermentalgiana]|eukprot:GBG25894.1 Phosphatidate cytidylyltransferase [Hondaea fermentalgiana]
MSTLRQRRIQEDESRQRAETSSLSSAGEDYLDEEEEEETAGESAAAPVTLLRDAPSETRFQSFVTRASWSLVMIFAFLFIVVYLQQTGCAVLVCIIQGLMYKELVVIQMNESSERDLPGFKFLYAYWFMVTSIFTYGKTLEGHFLMHSLRHHLGFKISDHLQKFDLYCYLLYAFGLILFVWSLKKKHYKYQFKQFAYCHVTLLLVVVQSSALVANMFHGLIWFLLPCSLVICNDIWAYIFGFFFGRTPLIKLSPKKTWEGFVGGWLATMFFGFFLSKIFTKFGLMICERRGFRLEYWPECEIDPIYEYRPLHDILGPRMNTMLPESISSMQVQQMDEHVLWMAIFASIVAPFGGFFASGFKRAFKIKDFGDSIPGHGGAVDRMDCQVLMGKARQGK